MKKKLFFILALAICAILVIAGCANEPESTQPTQTDAETEQPISPEEEESSVHSFYELNKNSNELLSHGTDNRFSCIELDYRTYGELDYSTGYEFEIKAFYPRMKKLPNGEYILFFQNGQHGTSVYYTTSTDAKNWAKPTLFLRQNEETGYYATLDAIVLNNGELLTVCSYRKRCTAPDSYVLHPEQNGIIMRKSSDNGKTWTDEKKIYIGTNWEPSILQLESGEIQVYFTNTTSYLKVPTIKDNSTGTAIIRSFDNGETWSSDLSKTYSGQIVSQTATRIVDGIQLYTDQMPVALKMLGSDKIMLAVETRVRDEKGNDSFTISISFSDDNWKTPLDPKSEGPAEKLNNIQMSAGGPYLSQFISGEIICSFSYQGHFRYRIFDATGKNYSDIQTNMTRLSGSLWSSTEVVDTHSLYACMEDRTSENGSLVKSVIKYGKFNLNHSIKSKKTTPTLDGLSNDWNMNDEAFFVGSESQAQASYRVTADNEYLYFLFERLDYDIMSEGDEMGIRFAGIDQKDFYRIDFNINGVTNFCTMLDKPMELPEDCVATKIYGTPDDPSDEDIGFTVEVKIPLSLIEGSHNEFVVMPILKNYDNEQTTDREGYSPTYMTNGDKSTWLHVDITD